MSRLLFEARAAVLACEAQQALIEKEIELEKLKQQRKPWVGLSEQEREKLRWQALEEDAGYTQLIKATEAKLLEKNGGGV